MSATITLPSGSVDTPNRTAKHPQTSHSQQSPWRPQAHPPKPLQTQPGGWDQQLQSGSPCGALCSFRKSTKASTASLGGARKCPPSPVPRALGKCAGVCGQPVDKFTDHHEHSSCHSHILWHQEMSSLAPAGQVADRVPQGGARGCRSSSSGQEEQASREQSRPWAPLQPYRHRDLPESQERAESSGRSRVSEGPGGQLASW